MSEPLSTININVGVLGHVDSGKTSLCKALSAVASTAAFDKSPQSTDRGITLDLGFSSATVDVGDVGLPTDVAARYISKGVGRVQITFVDCPGHASLIRTVVGGAGIVDLMVLVIDAAKGMQTQTAECMVVGEVLGRPLVVVINKCDELLYCYSDDGVRVPTAGGRAQLDKLKKRLEKVFRTQTRWRNVQFVETSASPAGPPTAAGSPPSPRLPPENTRGVLLALLQLDRPEAHADARKQVLAALEKGGAEGESARQSFFMYIDHCFSIKGQGTVVTGTVASGGLEVGAGIALPDYQVQKKVKSIQMFRKSAVRCVVGDRCGICIGAGFDASTLDRGVACSEGAIGSVNMLSFYYSSSNVSSTSRAVVDGPGASHMRQAAWAAFSEFAKFAVPGGKGIMPTQASMSSLVASLPSVVVSCNSFVAAVRKVKFHPLPLPSVGGPQMHITVGHTTAMGTLRYFSCPNPYYHSPGPPSLRVPAVLDEAAVLITLQGAVEMGGGMIPVGFDAEDMLQLDEDEPSLDGGDTASPTTFLPGEPAPLPSRRKLWFAVVNLETPITIFSNTHHTHTTFLASRLDFDADTSVCRMAVDGHVLSPLQDHRLRAFEMVQSSTTTTPSPPAVTASQPHAQHSTEELGDGADGAGVVVVPRPAGGGGLQFVRNNKGGDVVQPREVTHALKKKVVGSRGGADANHGVFPLRDPSSFGSGAGGGEPSLGGSGPLPQAVAWLRVDSPVWASPELARLVTDLLRYSVFVGFYPHPQTPNRLFHWRSVPALRYRVKLLTIASTVDDYSCVVSLPPKAGAAKEGGKPVYGDTSEYVGLTVECDLSHSTKKKAPITAQPAVVAPTTPVHRSIGTVTSTFGAENRQLRVTFKEPIFQKRGLEVTGGGSGDTQRLALPSTMQLRMVKRVYAPYGSSRIVQVL